MQANGRSSFREFVSLDIINDISDATTLASLRERLRKANVKDKLFGMFVSYQRDRGLKAHDGQFIDVTFDPAITVKESRCPLG